MADIAKIERACRAQSGPLSVLFRRHGAGWQCIIAPGEIMTDAEYSALMHRLSAPAGQELSPAERRRNNLRARASEADEGGRKYG